MVSTPNYGKDKLPHDLDGWISWKRALSLLQIKSEINFDMTTRADLEQMISMAALGNRREFQNLYNATAAKLFGICLRVLNNKSDAEEALQETYIKVWRSADRFESGTASPISWLATIARNTAIDHYRKKKPDVAGIEEADIIADEKPSPEAATVLSDDMSRLSGCMKELIPTHAEAVKEIYLGGWTYQEAAQKLGTPTNTVKTWVRRALIAIRECMNR